MTAQNSYQPISPTRSTVLVVVLLSLFTTACAKKEVYEDDRALFMVKDIPEDVPLPFMDWLTPQHAIIHKGVFNPTLSEYFFTISDTSFTNFTVRSVKKINGHWSEPDDAFFNSNYNEHGMSFSPDGMNLYFSSTRPTMVEGIPETWHIWRSQKVGGKWSEPTHLDIPNLRQKLLSHPSVSSAGTLYFHASNLDYGDMAIYSSRYKNGTYQPARRIDFSPAVFTPTCTPYIAPDESYLLFASVNDQLDLMISIQDPDNNWTNSRPLNEKINTDGQGNPYVTPDGKFLFFTKATREQDGSLAWSVQWIKTPPSISDN